jgi:hypothetical protein
VKGFEGTLDLCAGKKSAEDSSAFLLAEAVNFG